MKSARLLASCLALILCSAAAYADSPITSPQIRTSIDNWLGSAFRGESYSPRQVDRIGQKLVGEIGQKQTSIGAVECYWNSDPTLRLCRHTSRCSALRSNCIRRTPSVRVRCFTDSRRPVPAGPRRSRWSATSTAIEERR